MKNRFIGMVVVLLCVVFFNGCGSVEANTAKRTERLRQMYPPGVTTRDDVQKRWGANQPDWSETRPEGGWAVHANRYLAETMPLIEMRTGREIARMDRYWGPDGFMSLCYCWFYYDSTDHLIDVEWMYKSD